MAVRLLLAILALVILLASAARAEKRVALVIGNAAYKNAVTLQNPRNDATDVAEALRRLGFDTIVGLDLDDVGMKERSIAFARAARDADVALVYYSGHAMQFGGSNYLMPVDAALHDQADLRRLTRVDDIVADLKQAKNLRILVLDSCRVNPLAEELSRSMELTRGPPVDRGLARIVAARGMIISYATQAGQTAADGQGRNSPYTMAFLKNIETTEEIGTIFRNVTSDVYAATESKQLPELSLSLIGNFYLKGRPTIIADAPPTPPEAQPTSEAERAWEKTRDTTEQFVLENFIRQFGHTPYGSMAHARLEELKRMQAAPTVRVALVIGESNYKHAQLLSNPVADAQAIANMLKGIGFKVQFRKDLGYKEFIDVLTEFENDTIGADIAVIYYAGHGMMVKGANYLVPIDASFHAAHPEDGIVPVDRAADSVVGAAKLKLIILDACRGFPFPQKNELLYTRSEHTDESIGARDSNERDVRPLNAQIAYKDEHTIIAYATAEGSFTDDVAGKHSPFVDALLHHLAKPGLEVRSALAQVYREVDSVTHQTQRPAIYAARSTNGVFLAPAQR
jgi:uncharacterized caspase-like protein